MRSLQGWLSPAAKEDEELVRLFDDELRQFGSYDTIKTELSDRAIPWPGPAKKPDAENR